MTNGVGEHTYPLCRQHVQALVAVDETAIHEAMHHLLYRSKLAAEPGAAVGVAALRQGTVTLPPEGDVVVVVTGGNLAREELEAFL
ncbi:MULTISPECIES: pyridoxal-phosphate dependent enzyme [Halomonas]|uniref:pyridoxal-phosphate dependent enzyme n=1 Tax=Halomonas TaxID=2745 RepID=UPI00105CFDA1|nr:pyridoxal-phosphate dependent enzyme [Halomonas ventosae]